MAGGTFLGYLLTEAGGLSEITRFLGEFDLLPLAFDLFEPYGIETTERFPAAGEHQDGAFGGWEALDILLASG
eukprot:CAMPEP_0202449062 /NCGR_PEP_ID=MMETSP1360-20130828/7831_1 /ASSEMBLY_ACC=CAM_ASM_000848 /TAXON_ID=515479 /ORGANISM="Licmophora paradoxa, Strain CCMP2313" /LENGTH=72 /DNA_ID=CAMNT_0049066875 /DNA_START=498 /DNA_END=716 /DNA_ORIENTATION=-